MYGKIFDTIYDGTLAEDWRALITFQQLIVLCDSDGVIDMTPNSISRRTGIPIEHIKAGLEILEKPDPYSRTDSEEGRRILLIDEHRPWGWMIVNHKKYRDLKSKEERREYMKQYMRDRRKRESGQPETNNNEEFTDVNSKPQLAMLGNTDTDTDINKDIKGISSPSAKADPVPYQKIVDLYHQTLPDLPAVAKLTPKRKGQIRQRFKEDLKELMHWKNFFEYVQQSDFLMGRVAPTDGRKPFRADIEWLTNPSNFTKIAEEKYHV